MSYRYFITIRLFLDNLKIMYFKYILEAIEPAFFKQI
jgi:hypothetical protein